MVTIKQKLAFKEVTENHRPVSKAMLAVGYDPNTASKPSNLTNSKGWQELMEQHLPDKLLAKKHKEGLEATESDLLGERPDYAVRHKYLESAYKLKGRFITQEGNQQTQINVFISDVIAKKNDITPSSGVNSQ